MTPKEKAGELFEKMYDKVEDFDLLHEYPLFNGRKICAKQCAIIVVDEILDEFRKILPSSRKYWEDVKSEIEKL